MTDFWLDNPNILLNKNHITEIWPNAGFDLARKLNAITRIIVLMTILGYYLTKSQYLIISSIVSLVVLVMIYKSKNKIELQEGFKSEFVEPTNKDMNEILKKEFTMPTKKNPVMNILLNEYTENPKRKPAAPSYNDEVHHEINEKSKSDINKKLYKNLGDNLTFEDSMRNFYAMPSTSIPNNQKDFAIFCYGNMKSCKEGDGLQCSKNNAHFRNI